MKKILYKIILGFCIFLFLFSCQSERQSPEISFYYWKTEFTITKFEHEVLKKNKVKTLYIRYFDVELNSKTQMPAPRSMIKFIEKPEGFVVIPVVYIKNEVVLQKNINTAELARKICRLVDKTDSSQSVESSEIQLDCDWSPKSKRNFFELIQHLKKESKKKVSVTLRLHQIKYTEITGVPNADRGVLMYYNMGKIAADSLNSVYDREICKRYLSGLKTYVLPYDWALPIFSRAIHIRDGKVINLIGKSDVQSFAENDLFQVLSEREIKVVKSGFRNGYYFKKDDRLKIENIKIEDISEMISDLKQNSISLPEKIIFFDLDSFNLKNIPLEKYKI